MKEVVIYLPGRQIRVQVSSEIVRARCWRWCTPVNRTVSHQSGRFDTPRDAYPQRTEVDGVIIHTVVRRYSICWSQTDIISLYPRYGVATRGWIPSCTEAARSITVRSQAGSVQGINSVDGV